MADWKDIGGSSGEGEHQDGESHDVTEKSLLNRRSYLRLGATAAAVAFGAGTTASAAAGETFTTDFGEYGG